MSLTAAGCEARRGGLRHLIRSGHRTNPAAAPSRVPYCDGVAPVMCCVCSADAAAGRSGFDAGRCSRFCVEDSALHVTLRRIPALSPRWTGFGCSDSVGARPHSAYPRARSGCKAGFGHLLKMCKQKNLPGRCPKSGVSATAPRKRHNRDWFQLIPTKLSDMLALRSGATRPQIRAWRYTQPQCRG